MLSIIIPTLNEKNYLPALLESIKKQGMGLEVIVADAGSTDGTREVALSYGCQVVEGGLPAAARNNGAMAAHGELFFFLDADTVLPDGFLEKSLAEFGRRRLSSASFLLNPFPPKKRSAFFMAAFYNIPILALEKVLPHGATGILITKSLFEKISGYDTTITLAEDHDLVRRAAKKEGFGLIRSAKLPVSDRRFAKEGWVWLGVKFFLCELHMLFLGPVRTNIFNYQFNHYDKKK